MNAVDLKGITKRYTQVTANTAVDFNLREGEIHALLGENGAGKTTLMRILYGLSKPDEGTIHIRGSQAVIRSPQDAIRAGIGMVSQHFTLIPTMSVAENVTLGLEKGLVYDPKRTRESVAEAARRFNISIDPAALVRDLSVGERQRVEILKCLYRNARILILDEPTAVLVPQEVEQLFASLLRLKQQGLSLVFITHKLNEVMAICDRVTVLRGGHVVGTVDKASTTPAELAHLMVGHESFGLVRQMRMGMEEPGEAVIQLDQVSLQGRKRVWALRDVSLKVSHGEILGVAGVSGNGQRELSQVLCGIAHPTKGTILINQCDLTRSTPVGFTAAGVGRVPEDRHEGVIGELSVAENLVLERMEHFTAHGMLDRRRILEETARIIEEFQIKASPLDPIRTLSGGNMQKVLLARALSLNPQALIISQPTRGLDIGASEDIRNRLLAERGAGKAILMISEDLEEILTLSDRIAVMYEGRISGLLDASAATPELLGLYMSGAKMAVPA